MEIISILPYLITFASGAASGTYGYYLKVKGIEYRLEKKITIIEDDLKNKCGREQVENIVEKRLVFVVEEIKRDREESKKDLEMIKGILRSVAEQVGAKTPLK